MSDVAIRVENLSKLYTLGKRERYRTLRDTLTDALAAPFRRLRNGASPETEAETLWALKDVSFEVKHGEVLGVIGRNGAGKSTLLKILSRITEPTGGRAEIHGRVGSLLEVGTGFHPELTGRENIFLNGAILGMKKAEILRKFDEIVAFAEVEKFIDTPVKHYSSGMYVRLAFAVAAHLEPEILIVDEVLAVGDAEFQKKCLGKMGDVAAEGRTVLFVSHNMGAVTSLCTRVVCLANGTVIGNGEPRQVIQEYLLPVAENDTRELSQLRLSGYGYTVRFLEIELNGSSTGSLAFQRSLNFRFRIKADAGHTGLSIAGTIFNVLGTPIATFFCPDTFDMERNETREFLLHISNFNLAPDRYHAGFSIGKGGCTTARHDLDIVVGRPAFEISPVSDGDAHISEWDAGYWGNIVIPRTSLSVVMETVDELPSSADSQYSRTRVPGNALTHCETSGS